MFRHGHSAIQSAGASCVALDGLDMKAQTGEQRLHAIIAELRASDLLPRLTLELVQLERRFNLLIAKQLGVGVGNCIGSLQ
jgi:hypothetical protein